MGHTSSKRSVLIVEHRSAIARSVVGVLERMHDVELLGSLSTATLSLTHAPAAPDVVVCGFGVLLPETAARLAALRSQWPQTHLIALSFDPHGESREQALDHGADAYVSGLNLSQELPPAIAAGGR